VSNVIKFLQVATIAAALFSIANAQALTGQYSCASANSFTLCQNLWGISAGSGSQSSTLISSNSQSISWSTNWTWANNPNNVKSYPNVESTTAKGVQLQNIASAPTSWTWQYLSQSSGLRADVSYDIWFGTQSSGNPASSASSYEIMIWLSGLGGIQPVGSQITSGTSVGGHTWNIWKGPNSNWEVISFVSSTGDITNFNADLNAFFKYLTANQGVPTTQYVQAIQSGTECFTGQANLLTNSFSVSINQN
jgi:xyloglucan-specific endo-beta-1,4-glucanase